MAKGEWKIFREARQGLDEFRELHGFMQNMSMFLWEWRTLYLQITRELSVPSFWNRRTVSSHLAMLGPDLPSIGDDQPVCDRPTRGVGEVQGA